jgi:hypothetical protein
MKLCRYKKHILEVTDIFIEINTTRSTTVDSTNLSFIESANMLRQDDKIKA